MPLAGQPRGARPRTGCASRGAGSGWRWRPPLDLTKAQADLRRVPFMLALGLDQTKRFQSVDPGVVQELLLNQRARDRRSSSSRPERAVALGQPLEIVGLAGPRPHRPAGRHLPGRHVDLGGDGHAPLLPAPVPRPGREAPREQRFPWEPLSGGLGGRSAMLCASCCTALAHAPAAGARRRPRGRGAPGDRLQHRPRAHRLSRRGRSHRRDQARRAEVAPHQEPALRRRAQRARVHLGGRGQDADHDEVARVRQVHASSPRPRSSPSTARRPAADASARARSCPIAEPAPATAGARPPARPHPRRRPRAPTARPRRWRRRRRPRAASSSSWTPPASSSTSPRAGRRQAGEHGEPAARQDPHRPSRHRRAPGRARRGGGHGKGDRGAREVLGGGDPERDPGPPRSRSRTASSSVDRARAAPRREAAHRAGDPPQGARRPHDRRGAGRHRGGDRARDPLARRPHPRDGGVHRGRGRQAPAPDPAPHGGAPGRLSGRAGGPDGLRGRAPAHRHPHPRRRGGSGAAPPRPALRQRPLGGRRLRPRRRPPLLEVLRPDGRATAIPPCSTRSPAPPCP